MPSVAVAAGGEFVFRRRKREQEAKVQQADEQLASAKEAHFEQVEKLEASEPLRAALDRLAVDNHIIENFVRHLTGGHGEPG